MSRPREKRWVSRLGALAGAVGVLGLVACETEENVVGYKPFFAGLPGAEGGKDPVYGDRASDTGATGSAGAGGAAGVHETDLLMDDPLDPNAASSDPLVVENADGSKTLVVRSIRHVMTHIERRLDEGEEGEKLLYEQVVADAAKKEYAEQGKSEAQMMEYLREHRRDIAVLFSRLPFAEHTPGVYLKKRARNRFVLELPPLAKKGSNFSELWVQMEGGQWKFLWVK